MRCSIAVLPFTRCVAALLVSRAMMHSMRRGCHSARGLLALSAALQLVIPGAVAWADARLEAAVSHPVAHVEAQSSGSCVRIHPTDCAFHRFISTLVVPGRHVSLPVGAGSVGLATLVSHNVEVPLPRERLPDSRAPPALL